MIPFNYHHLYYFYVIAQSGSVSKAAKELRLAQPTLSAQLKQFEYFLDKKLFHRESRKLILTEDGHYVLSYAKMIFDLGKEMSDRISDFSQKGRVRIQIGVSNFVPKAFVDDVLKFFLRKEPGVYISLIEDKIEGLANRLNDHFLDLVLHDSAYDSVDSPSIENHLLAKIPIVFCVHPKQAARYKAIPKDLNNAPMLLPTEPSQTLKQLQDYFFEVKIKPRIVGEIQDIELVRRLVLAGVGIAPLNLHSVLNAPAKDKLAVLKIPKQEIFEKIFLIFKKRKRAHPLVELFLKEFRFSSPSEK